MIAIALQSADFCFFSEINLRLVEKFHLFVETMPYMRRIGSKAGPSFDRRVAARTDAPVIRRQEDKMGTTKRCTDGM
ncbi:hypothetical protein [Roseobacter sp. A03A-229]